MTKTFIAGDNRGKSNVKANQNNHAFSIGPALPLRPSPVLLISQISPTNWCHCVYYPMCGNKQTYFAGVGARGCGIGPYINTT